MRPSTRRPARPAADPLAAPLRLPCGAVLPNRLAKAAMTEGLADPDLRATPRLATLYRRWSEGGAGLLVTGNVQVDRRYLERPGNVVIDDTWPATTDATARRALADWSAAGRAGGSALWMQISHAGRQTPRYVSREPVAPSPVPLDLLGNYARPRAIEEHEILAVVRRFATAATIARECGFSGVQVHAAHGYLLSSFLSPHTNRRTDAWGGSLANRARIVLEVVREVRRAVGADFPLAVKLNSDDFRTGGFAHDECVQVARWLDVEGIDLLEISGGTYEQPRLFGAAGRAGDAVEPRPSTVAREAYFLSYAQAIRGAVHLPLMVTGGFRTRAGMEAALASGDADVIGLARPLCSDPDAARRLLERSIDTLPADERGLHLAARGWLSAASPLVLMKVVNLLGAQGWYYHQIERLADGLAPDLQPAILRPFLLHSWRELTRAAALRR